MISENDKQLLKGCWLELKKIFKEEYALLLKSMLIAVPFLILTFLWVMIIKIEPNSLLNILLISILPIITSVGPSAIYILCCTSKGVK